ncbi:hypothetical protein FHS18_006913 [Paenibacillus phyllosphaerae]|uniref:DUF2500 domain-containing protein n=1 Tax=Paenibacillus phyllosphaerae TaxID=274593 RepID=A0A7W5B5F7_9BACL|nr:DUF2500 domain-containing protein [Paenibacillus phyllosphaerae]MBB3114755.1 hypothetical protein [Paenibacillus phyllosphaerae]
MNRFSNDPGFFGFMAGVPLFFKLFGGLVLTLVIGGFLYVIIRGVSTWSSNNASELLTRTAVIVDKRTEVWGGSRDSSASTNYYITFEFEDQSRMELPVRGDKYGLMVVGDRGNLTYQGTRFKDFDRFTR